MKRRHTDERWKAVQTASFDWDGEMLSRTRTRGNETMLRAMSAALSALAGTGVLRPMPLNKNAREHIKDWHEQKCALFVEKSLRGLLGTTGAMMAEELVGLKGARDACEAFIEKWNAACARASSRFRHEETQTDDPLKAGAT
jgi:hypothetical protein